VLASRIDRLGEREKQVLQTASVIGKQFSETLLRQVLARVAPLDDAALDEAIAALVAAEFLYEASVWPRTEYSFKHPLTQEVAQRSQLRTRQIRVHAAVAQALEDALGNSDERAAEIAQHWAEAEERGRAAVWHKRAAEWADFSDMREAVRNWRRVRELALGVTDAAERTALSLLACQRIFTHSWRLGGSEEEIASVFAEGRALAEQIGDRSAVAILTGFYGMMRGMVAGSASDQIRYGEEAAAIAADSQDANLRAAMNILAGLGHYFTGDGLKTLAWSDRVISETESDNTVGKAIMGFSPRLGTLHWRTKALLCLGRLAEARRQCEEGIHAAEGDGEIEIVGWLKWVSVMLVHAKGGREPALEAGRRALEIAEQLDDELSRVDGYCGVGTAYLIEGQFAEARDTLRMLAAFVLDRRMFVQQLPWYLAVLAEAHLALGEHADAAAAAREGAERGRAGGCHYYEASARIALAQVLLVADGASARAEIEAALDRAEDLVTAIEGRSLSPRILELRGHLAAALGDAPGSERALRAALDLYREIGAAGHAERLEQEIGV
jgi:adenylate cyclase